MQTKKRLSMIQSPRGQLNVIASIGFPSETAEDYMNPDPNITSSQTQDTNNIDSLNHLVWSNPIRTNLHPQILRQIAFSDNLLHTIDNDLLKQPQRMLISSFKVENGTVIAPLLNFYLSLGLKCTKIYRFGQYIPKKCFNNFVQSVVDAR